MLMGILSSGDIGEALIDGSGFTPVTSQAQAPAVPLSQIAFRADGTLEWRVLGAAWVPVSGQWFVSGVKEDMEVVVTTNSGSPSGTPSGWVSGVAETLGVTDRVWQRNDTTTTGGFETWNADYEIFHTPTSTSLSGPDTIVLRARQTSS